jgi:hypothetical protein
MEELLEGTALQTVGHQFSALYSAMEHLSGLHVTVGERSKGLRDCRPRTRIFMSVQPPSTTLFGVPFLFHTF